MPLMVPVKRITNGSDWAKAQKPVAKNTMSEKTPFITGQNDV
jgi:hypothetical protein